MTLWAVRRASSNVVYRPTLVGPLQLLRFDPEIVNTLQGVVWHDDSHSLSANYNNNVLFLAEIIDGVCADTDPKK